jgi:hypothetical protein
MYPLPVPWLHADLIIFYPECLGQSVKIIGIGQLIKRDIGLLDSVACLSKLSRGRFADSLVRSLLVVGLTEDHA